jgi:hypothetical protein
MPAATPRLYFTPEPGFEASVRTIARLTKQPASRVIADALVVVAPYLSEVASTLEAVDAAEKKARKLGESYVGEFKRKLDPHILAVSKAASNAENVVKAFELKRPRFKLSPKITAN